MGGAYPDDSSGRGCLAGGVDVRAHNYGEAYAAQPNAPKIEKNVRHGTEPNLGVGGGDTASRPEQFLKPSRGAPDFNAGDYTKPAMTFKLPTAAGNASSNDNYYNTAYRSESVFTTYLERQTRNEYVNLARQIGYDGHNIAFIFYENQIRALMAESPCQERRLENVRASCSGQPRGTVNLFLAPMRNLSTSERIEKALDRLRQRYVVSGGSTTEPLVGAIRNGSKISFNAASLKLFNEDLNTLEVFAYAHNEVEKLSGQLLMDVANRLPGVLKRRYLDHLSHKRLDLNRPGFDSLREFIAHELSVMTSDYAQSFFKLDQTEKSRDHGAVTGRGSAVRVRSAVVISAKLPHNSENAKRGRFNSGETQNSGRPSPICFVCNDPKLRHYLGECKKFQTLTNENKRRAVIDAGRCFNCLSTDHIAKNCPKGSKCKLCGLESKNKHAAALHSVFAQSGSDDLGAANVRRAEVSHSSGTEGYETSDNNEPPTVRKLAPNNCATVVLRTCAVRVFNPGTNKCTLAYAQHDTASQATLVSEQLKYELGLNVNANRKVRIRTLAEQTSKSSGCTSFKLQSLATDEVFAVNNALVPNFEEDEKILPHAVNVKNLKHFKGVKIRTISNRKTIDILIGQSDKSLLAVIEERESLNAEEQNCVLTRLVPIASGGQVKSESPAINSLKVQIDETGDSCRCEQLEREVSSLKQILRELELEDEVVQPSRMEVHKSQRTDGD